MKNQKRIRDYGIIIGQLTAGAKNSITDVAGIKVGHVTIDEGKAKTGVTAIIPSADNIFKNKLFAAAHVINGFGKTAGTIQIDELGTLETPIILTNTLSVGIAADALIEYMLQQNSDIGIETGTVNPVVCECNDGYINYIRGGYVKKEHVFQAIENAADEFYEGDVGAGKGMCCFGLKGGIGTASRIVGLDGNKYTLGVLVLSNYGQLDDLTINGARIGLEISDIVNRRLEERKENGSIITIIATDIPMSSRQLKRTAKRAAIGINRTGGFMGNGSGEIVISFSTGNVLTHYKNSDVLNIKIVHEDNMNSIFMAAAEATEEAILNSLVCSEGAASRNGNRVVSLREYFEKTL